MPSRRQFNCRRVLAASSLSRVGYWEEPSLGAPSIFAASEAADRPAIFAESRFDQAASTATSQVIPAEDTPSVLALLFAGFSAFCSALLEDTASICLESLLSAAATSTGNSSTLSSTGFSSTGSGVAGLDAGGRVDPSSRRPDCTVGSLCLLFGFAWLAFGFSSELRRVEVSWSTSLGSTSFAARFSLSARTGGGCYLVPAGKLNYHISAAVRGTSNVDDISLRVQKLRK